MRARVVTFRCTSTDDREIEVTGEYSPGDPGRTSGPPELCYPPEGPEFEVTEVRFVGGGDCPDELLPSWDDLCERAAQAADDIDAAYLNEVDAKAGGPW